MLRSTIYLWAFVASAGLAVICLLLNFVFAAYYFSLYNIVSALFIISLSFLSAAGCERVKEHGRYRKSLLTGIIASWFACLAWLVLAFEDKGVVEYKGSGVVFLMC